MNRAGRNPPRILVVEDDTAVREAVTAALEDEGYEVHAAATGIGIEAAADAFAPDLAVLDVRLPGGPSGLGVARSLHTTRALPVIFLSAADEESDRLAGFAAGADDYLVKPFSMAELLARVKALLRRSGRLTSEAWQVGDLVVDEAARTASRAGRPLDLTKTEFDVLVTLGRRPGQVVSKTQLLAEVWGFAEYDANLVEVFVSNLRRKVEAHGPRLIQTVRGVGYALRP